MPKLKKSRLDRRKEKVSKAIELARIGYTVREIGKIIGMSHGWVALVVKANQGYPQENIDTK